MNKFIKLWIISTAVLFAGSVCLFVARRNMESIGLQLTFSILSFYGELLLLRACCLVCKYQYKSFWDRYGLVLFVYSIIMIFLKASPSLVLLPFLVFQILIVTSIVLIVLVKWPFVYWLKAAAVLIIGSFGIFRVYAGMFSNNEFLVEVMLVDAGFLMTINILYAVIFHTNVKIENTIREGYMKNLVEKAVDIVFYYTLHPYPAFLFISPSVEQIVGYKQFDFYNNPKLFIEITHEEDREIIKGAFSKEVEAGIKNYIRWQRRDGEFIYLEYHNNPIVEGGRIIAVGGVLRDITDRKMAEKEMLESKKAKQIFQSYISHELRTPITYIMGYAEMLQKDCWEDEQERRNAIDLISSKAIFLKTLVEDLFQLSKMESNQFTFELVQITVEELFAILDRAYQKDVLKSNIEYLSYIEPKIIKGRLEVLADIKRIEQVYVNILQNAIKHAPNSDVIKFGCYMDELGENILFKVTDTGKGISSDEAKKIFEPFYRSDEARANDASGSGLGLSLSRQIMTAHKGELYVKSKKGKGSEFVFTLPVYLEG